MSERQTFNREDKAEVHLNNDFKTLEDLLDNALQDFETSTVKTSTMKTSTQTLESEVGNTDTKSTETERFLINNEKSPSKRVEFKSSDEQNSQYDDFEGKSNSNIEYVDKLLIDFQQKMKDILENETTDEEKPGNSNGNNKLIADGKQKKFSEIAQDTLNNLISESSSGDKSNDFHPNNSDKKLKDFKDVISQAIKNLRSNCEELDDSILMDSSDDIAKLINDLTFKDGDEIGESEIEAHFSKSFIKIGQKLLYPPLRNICTKYPIYLAKNKLKISKETYDNYEKQYENMLEICKIYEGTELNQQKCYDVLTIMQQVQNCGLPPQELIEPENFEMYDEMMSGLRDTSSNKNNQHCTIL